jgi:hypothetical protein
MSGTAESQPPTRIYRDRSLEWTLVVAILIGGAIGACLVLAFAMWIGAGRTAGPASSVRPTAIVVTATPSPVVPTPTALQTPTPLPPPTPDQLTVGGYARVSGTGGDTLRLRSDPGLQTTTLKTVPEGSVLLILDGPRDADDIAWWRLRDPSDGAEGWAAQLYLAPSGAP